MSKVTDRINYWVFKRRITNFLLPSDDFTAEDQPLIDSGVFVKSEKEREAVYCPFGCGDLEDIIQIRRNDGTIGRYVICKYGEGERYLEPKEYELMRFVPEAYMRNWASKEVLQGPDAPKKKAAARTARSTPFMKEQREAVLNYLQSRNRPASSVTVRDCTHVWNLPENKAKWDRRAKLTSKYRGYGSPSLLWRGIRHQLNAI